jgi:hypothetical protein
MGPKVVLLQLISINYYHWNFHGLQEKKIKIKIKTPGGFYTPIRLSWSGWARPC